MADTPDLGFRRWPLQRDALRFSVSQKLYKTSMVMFVIETKTRSRRNATINQREHFVTFDGRALQFPWGQDAKAAEQARRNA